MADPLTSAGAVANTDRVAAELSTRASLLGRYRSRLLRAGFHEHEAFGLCEMWFREQLCHGLSEGDTDDQARRVSAADQRAEDGSSLSLTARSWLPSVGEMRLAPPHGVARRGARGDGQWPSRLPIRDLRAAIECTNLAQYARFSRRTLASSAPLTAVSVRATVTLCSMDGHRIRARRSGSSNGHGWSRRLPTRRP